MASIGQYKGKDINAGDDASVQAQIRQIDSTPSVSVQKYRDNPDGTTTNFFSDGTQENVTYSKGGNGSLNANPITVDGAKVAQTPIKAESINPVNSTYAPPAPTPAIATSVAVDATANRQPMQPPTPEAQAQTQKQGALQKYLDRINPGKVAEQKAQLREESDLQARSDEANRLQAELKERKKSYRDQIEGILTQGRGVPQSITQRQADDLRRKANNDLADIAIQAEFAMNNYLGAEKILQARLDDLDTEFDNEIKAYQIASDFLTNDLSDSEKQELQFKQDELMAQHNFERQKLLSEFEQRQLESSPLYQAQVAATNRSNQPAQATSDDLSAYVVAYQNGQIPLTQVPANIRGQVLATVQASGTNKMLDLLKQYKDKITGLNVFTANFPGNKTSVDSLKGQIVAEYKQQKQLGTLDNGVQTLVDKIIPDPSKLSVSSLSNSAQVTALNDFIKNQGGDTTTLSPEDEEEIDNIASGGGGFNPVDYYK